jgi:type II secretory pathway pseudopilin PulG
MVQARGFLLLEALVAIAIAVLVVASLGRFSAIGREANRRAADATFAWLAAHQKAEQLRALAWGFDASGQPVSDTTTDVASVPDRPFSGVGLSASPPDSLDRDVGGFCDFLDAAAQWIASGPARPAAAAYSRRWSVTPLASAPDRALVVQVAVFGRARSGALARIVYVRTRTVP